MLLSEPFVDADDIAEIAVAVLTEDGHAGELWELTEPRLLTFAEAVSEVLDGRNAQLADGVERALGRAPRDFRDYARDTAASGAWAG